MVEVISCEGAKVPILETIIILSFPWEWKVGVKVALLIVINRNLEGRTIAGAWYTGVPLLGIQNAHR